MKRAPLRVTRAWRASRGNRFLLAEAVLCLGLARLSVLVVPFRWTSAWLVRQRHVTDGQARLDVVERIAAAVPRVSRFTPWRSNCLAQGLAAHAMLRRRGVASTLHLGLMKDDADRVAAHAWLTAGPCIVTGGRGHERFTRVFSGEPDNKEK